MKKYTKNIMFCLLFLIKQNSLWASAQESDDIQRLSYLFTTSSLVQADPDAFKKYIIQCCQSVQHCGEKKFYEGVEAYRIGLIGYLKLLWNSHKYSSILEEYLAQGDEAGVALLTLKNANLTTLVTSQKIVPLAAAIQSGHTIIAQNLVAAGTDIMANQQDENSPFRFALRYGNKYVVRQIIAHPDFDPTMITPEMTIHGDVYDLVQEKQRSKQQDTDQTTEVQKQIIVRKLSSHDDEDMNWQNIWN